MINYYDGRGIVQGLNLSYLNFFIFQVKTHQFTVIILNSLSEFVSKSIRRNGLNTRFLSQRLFQQWSRQRRQCRDMVGPRASPNQPGVQESQALHYSSRYLFGLTSATGSKSTFQIWVRTACPPPSRIPQLCLALQLVILSDMVGSGRVGGRLTISGP